MFRRLGLLGAVCGLAVLLSGCISLRSHVTVNADGSADVEYLLTMDSKYAAALKMRAPDGLPRPDDPFEKLRGDLLREGFKVYDYNWGGQEGFRAIKHVAKIKDLPVALNSNAINVTTGFHDKTGGSPFARLVGGLKVHHGLFSDRYTLNSSMNLTAIKKPAATTPNDFRDPQTAGKKFNEAISTAMVDDMSFTLTLPVKAKSTNASIVSDGGRTMEWPLKLGEKTVLKADVVVTNKGNIVLISCCGGGLLLILLAFIFTRAASNRPTPPRRPTIPTPRTMTPAAK